MDLDDVIIYDDITTCHLINKTHFIKVPKLFTTPIISVNFGHYYKHVFACVHVFCTRLGPIPSVLNFHTMLASLPCHPVSVP